MCTAKRMKDRRLQLGLSAETMAEKIGVARSTYFRYENGDIEKLPVALLPKIASALRTTPEYLAGWDDKVSDSTARIAAHIDDDVTDDQMEDIINYIEFIKSKK